MSYKPISEEMKANIADDLEVGCTYSEIADRYGVSYSTIKRIRDKLPVSTSTEQKKSPEAVPTPIEPASEEIKNSGSSADTNIIPDVPEVVKPDALLNSAIDDAVLDRIEKLGLRIDEIMKERRALEIERNTLIEYHEKFKEAQNNGT